MADIRVVSLVQNETKDQILQRYKGKLVLVDFSLKEEGSSDVLLPVKYIVGLRLKLHAVLTLVYFKSL